MPIRARKLPYLVERAFRGDPAEPVHQPQRLDSGNEIIRENQSKLGMFPSRQSLNPGHDAGGNIELWLVVNHKLIAIEGPAQVLVADCDVLLLLFVGSLLGPDIGEKQLLQLTDWKGLLEMSDDGKTQRLSQLFGGLDHPDVDTAH